MIDGYSFTVGLALGAFMAGIYQIGKHVREQEIARVHRAKADFDTYFGEQAHEDRVSWFPRKGA